MSRPLSDESVFRAIGHVARRKILEQLRTGDRPASELVAMVKLSQPTVSEHLRMLRNSGLIGQKRRGRQRIYRLHRNALQVIAKWVAPFNPS